MFTTAKMLFDMMAGICDAPKDLSKADRREICSGIILNNKIVTMHKNIVSVEPKINSTYSIHTQVNELAPTIDANILIKPETKSALKTRITNLLALLKQAINIGPDTNKDDKKEETDFDTRLTALDKTAMELKAQLLNCIKSYFSRNKSQQATMDKEAITQAVDERSKEASLVIKSFNALYPQIGSHYEEIRNATPGTSALKTLKAIETPHAAAENQLTPRNE